MTSAIFRYAIRHIFMVDFLLSAMNRHLPLTTLDTIHGRYSTLFSSNDLALAEICRE